jgi:hypothetical protein
VFKPRLFLGGRSACFSKQVLQSGPARSSCQPLPPAEKAWELNWAFWSTFFWEGCQFQLTTSFYKRDECAVIFPRMWLSHPSLAKAGSAQHFTPPLKLSFCLLGHQLCPGGEQSAHSDAGLCGFLQSRQRSTLTWGGWSFTRLY